MNKKQLLLIIVLILFALLFSTRQEVHSDIETESKAMTWTTQKCDIQEIEEKFITRNWKRNELVTKAFELSEGDIDFLLTVEAESRWNTEAIGDHWNSKGLCQWHKRWQKSVRQDPNFSDPDWQLQKCFEFYQWYKKAWIIHKRLYWYNVRKKHSDLIKIQTGSLLVLNCSK